MVPLGSPHQVVLDTYLQDAASFRAALNILTGPEHAQCHAVQHDNQHANVLEPPAGCSLRAVQHISSPCLLPGALPLTQAQSAEWAFSQAWGRVEPKATVQAMTPEYGHQVAP